MKKLVLLIMLSSFGVAPAQITPIKDIQFTADESGDSPMVGETVTISGIVTGEPYAFGGDNYYVQDAEEAWSGIAIYDPGRQVAEGDSVTLTGEVSEYYNVTQLSKISDFRIDAEGVFGIEPMPAATGDLGTGGTLGEALEGCLVRVENAAITNPDLGYGEWEIDDGSGPCRVDDKAEYYFNPSKYDTVVSLTGIHDFSFYERKIQPRLAFDIIEEGPYTRVQRIQQVRYSDLMKTPVDNVSDFTYLDGDTVSMRGVVTMPTGLSYAGAGIKFIFGDPDGGPWSAILSYNGDSTAYPTLFEGDEIETTGYIGEYTTDPSNMTELWVTSPINILSFDNPLPDPDSIATGDLRWPTTAEQWGNVIVRVGNATVTDVTPTQYDLFALDDGSGECLVDDDSDSLTDYPDPPVGTIAERISGWVYHHYGSYADSTTYKLEPLYRSDIIWGAGPPAVENTMRAIASPGPGDVVSVTTDVATNLEINAVTLYYKVGEGDYATVVMNEIDGEAGTFLGEIPAQAAGSYVSYYIEAEDSEGQSTTDPSKPDVINYSYLVKDGPLVIRDIQYTPWELADSPFEGYKVEVTGVVTVDTSFYNNYGAYAIQDAEGAWNGIFVFGAIPALERGDVVKIYGTVTDYNADWHFKWDNNTVILADSVVKMTDDDRRMPAPVTVQTADLATGTESAESYEGVLTKVENATIISVNDYDFTVDDGSGGCLVDDDGIASIYLNIDSDAGVVVAAGDTFRVGDQISFIQGVFLFSFGTSKIEVRDLNDMGIDTGVRNAVTAKPLTYALEQNYPNPFNPETRIYFQLAGPQKTQLVIYNLRGQVVRTLVDRQYGPGHHVVNWDGRDNYGIRVPSGMYIYRIKAGDFIAHKKMMLVK